MARKLVHCSIHNLGINKLILVTNTPNTAALNFEDGLSALTSLSAVIDIQGESSFFLRYNGYFSHELLNY